jgi:hypothetical protein
MELSRVVLFGLVLPQPERLMEPWLREVLGAQTRTPGKIVSIFESWAQIIRKAKLARPTEFGMQVKVQEAEGGIVSDIAVDEARADAPLLVPGSDREAPRRAPLILTFSPQAGRRDRNGCVGPRIPTPAQPRQCYSRPFCTAV